MKTKVINLYQFSELSDEAKEKAINNFRNNENDFYFITDDAGKSFEKFADIFSISNWDIDYCEPYRNNYRLNFDDNVKALSGQRLANYIWNNYRNDIFKGNYYSLWSKTEVSFKYYKEGHPVLKTRHSKIQLSNSCVLTGVCYDNDVLNPIYDFLDKPKDNIDFETLISDCIYSLCHSVNSEIEYQYTDEAIIETIEANEYDFDEDGNLA